MLLIAVNTWKVYIIIIAVVTIHTVKTELTSITGSVINFYNSFIINFMALLNKEKKITGRGDLHNYNHSPYRIRK